MIDQATIDRIVDAANIVDVVSEYVTLRRSGASYKGLCPFHDDKTPSFYVSPAKGVCKCFSCGKGGNAVHFIMEQEQLSYYEALKFLAKKYGIEVQERQMTEAQRQSQNERESMFAVNEWASMYFNETLLNTSDGQNIGLAYFRSRGFRDDIIEKFRLGFSLSQPTAMSSTAKRKGYKEEYLVKTGLCFRRDDGTLRDRYVGRVMFPWFSISGKVVAFGGRVLDSRTKGVNQKYINSPESEIYRKSNELYGIWQAKKAIVKEDRVYMVEGYTDVISMHQCGVENVVANSGTALNEAQIRLLHRFTSEITLLYDGDGAGIHAALRGTDMLLAEGMNVKILLLPDGEDPDSFARKHNASEFKAYVESKQTDFIIFKTNLLIGDAGRDPLKRAQLVKDIVKSISVIPEEIIRSTYIHECSELLGVDEMILVRECNKNRKAELERIKKEKERARERANNIESLSQTMPPAQSGDGMPDVDNIPPPEILSTDVPPPFDSSVPEPQSPALGNNVDDIPFDASAYIPTDVNESANAVYLQPKNNREEQKFIGLEKMIMSLVVRYGERQVFLDDKNEAKKQTLAEYINNEMSVDGLAFRHQLYADMLSDAVDNSKLEGFVASRHFLNSPMIEVSREAAELVGEQMDSYSSSGEDNNENNLEDKVMHLLLDYKFFVVEYELRQVSSLLASPEVLTDSEKCMEIMARYQNLCGIKRKLAHYLGDRVFMK